MPLGQPGLSTGDLVFAIAKRSSTTYSLLEPHAHAHDSLGWTSTAARRNRPEALLSQLSLEQAALLGSQLAQLAPPPPAPMRRRPPSAQRPLIPRAMLTAAASMPSLAVEPAAASQPARDSAAATAALVQRTASRELQAQIKLWKSLAAIVQDGHALDDEQLRRLRQLKGARAQLPPVASLSAAATGAASPAAAAADATTAPADAAAAAAAPPQNAPAEGSAQQRGGVGGSGGVGGGKGGKGGKGRLLAARRLAEEGEAAEWALYTACFWPLHVWKREVRRALRASAKVQLTAALWRGILRLRCYRAWRALPALVAREAAAMRAALRRAAKRSALARWFERCAERGYEARLMASGGVVALRARALAARPFLVLWFHARCRALVRARSYSLLLLPESHVPPLPLPGRGRAAPECRALVTGALVADKSSRVVTRMRRARLAPLLLHVLRRNVLRRRRKRWAADTGGRRLLLRMLRTWVRYAVLFSMDSDDDDGGGGGGGGGGRGGGGGGGGVRRAAEGRTFGLYLKQRHGLLLPEDLSVTGRLMIDRAAAKRAARRARAWRPGAGPGGGPHGSGDIDEDDDDDDDAPPLAGDELQAEYLVGCERRVQQYEANGDGLRRRRAQLREHGSRNQAMVLAYEDAAAAAERGLRQTLVDVGRWEGAERREKLLRVKRLVDGRCDHLARTYARVAADFSEQWRWHVARQCFVALAVPVQWRGAIRLSNRCKLRRMLRICARRNYLYRGMPLYRRLRVLHRCVWAWLQHIERKYTYTTPGLAASVAHRRMRCEAFSVLLVAERDPSCPRCCFARWMEWTQKEVAKREMVRLALRLRDARLMATCFGAVRTGLKRQHLAGFAEGQGKAFLIANVEHDIDKWAVGFVRPELHSDWMRRRHAWVRKRALRNAARSNIRLGLVAFQAELASRARRERQLVFEWQAAGGGRELGAALQQHWAGALRLREHELGRLWAQRGEPLARRVADAEAMAANADFGGAGRLGAMPRCAVGLGRWLFNALSHRLPKRPPDELLGAAAAANAAAAAKAAKAGGGARAGRVHRPSSTVLGTEREAAAKASRLPPEHDQRYWSHMRGLLEQSAALTKRARYRSAA